MKIVLWMNYNFVLWIVECWLQNRIRIITLFQVSSVKKFIKNVNPHVANFFFHLSFTAFLASIWDVKRNYIHTFSWKSLLKSHFFPPISCIFHWISIVVQLPVVSILDWISGGDWFNKLYSALWSFYSLTYINVRVKC